MTVEALNYTLWHIDDQIAVKTGKQLTIKAAFNEASYIHICKYFVVSYHNIVYQ